MNENESAVTSPCIRHCCLNDDDICVGCFRSLSEIVTWSELTFEGKREVLAECKNREKRQTDKIQRR